MGVTLFAVRHAPTDAQGLCVGQHDVPTLLSASEAATAIRGQVPRPPSVVHSSPLSRCAAPAALLSVAWGCPHQVDARLHELSFGAWQGRSWASLEQDEPERVAQYMQRWRHEPPPGGESPLDLQRRVQDWYTRLPAGEHLLVAHAGVVRALRVLLHGDTWDEVMQASVPHLTLLPLAQDS